VERRAGVKIMAGAGAERGAGNGAGSGSQRNRFERRPEILPLPLRSHALAAAIGHHAKTFLFYFRRGSVLK